MAVLPVKGRPGLYYDNDTGRFFNVANISKSLRRFHTGRRYSAPPGEEWCLMRACLGEGSGTGLVGLRLYRSNRYVELGDMEALAAVRDRVAAGLAEAALADKPDIFAALFPIDLRSLEVLSNDQLEVEAEGSCAVDVIVMIKHAATMILTGAPLMPTGKPDEYITRDGHKIRLTENEQDFVVDVDEGEGEKEAAEAVVALVRPGWRAMFLRRESAGCNKCEGPIARYHFALQKDAG